MAWPRGIGSHLGFNAAIRKVHLEAKWTFFKWGGLKGHTFQFQLFTFVGLKLLLLSALDEFGVRVILGVGVIRRHVICHNLWRPTNGRMIFYIREKYHILINCRKFYQHRLNIRYYMTWNSFSKIWNDR